MSTVNPSIPPNSNTIAGWEYISFGELTKPSANRIGSTSVDDSGLIVELENLEQVSGRFIYSKRHEAVRSDKTVFFAGDILFGKLRPYLRKFWLADHPGVCSTEIWVFRPSDSRLLGDFLRYIVESEYFLRSATSSFGTHMPRADWKVVRESLVLLPPKGEQEKISMVLSDIDSLINQLDALIAKKRDIKQGAMKELLTGKTRLPGFSGEFMNLELGGIFENIVGGGTPARTIQKYWGGQYPWVTVKDLTTFNPTSSQEYITSEGLAASSTRIVRLGTLILCTRMAVGKAVIFEVDVCINQDLKAVTFKPFVDTKFMYFWFEREAPVIAKASGGSTVAGLSLGDLKRFSVRLPSLSEQVAIAEVLSDMDVEIEALVARREKTALIKTGMMQELLTGRTRLL